VARVEPCVNMVSGTTFPFGDAYVQRQDEPSGAVSSRNPLHLLAGANDYRAVDIPGLPGKSTGDAWLGVFKSHDGGQTWTSTLLPGFPQDSAASRASTPAGGYQAGADPVVRAGTSGMFYYTGIVFDRVQTGLPARSLLFVSRFVDNNNSESGETIQYLDTNTVDTAEIIGHTGVFIDKPWLAVDVPRAGAPSCTVGSGVTQSTFPAGNLYVAYTRFEQNSAEDSEGLGSIYLKRSSDCGRTYSQAVLVASYTAQYVNQGAVVVVNPANGDVYLIWRRFYLPLGAGKAEMVFSKAPFGSLTFSAPTVIREFSPFDQGSTYISFRTNSLPTMAVDGDGNIYAAWSQRGSGPGADARVVVSVSTNGGNSWGNPIPVDNPPGFRGHQIMPAAVFAAGKLSITYYDLRETQTQGYITGTAPGPFVETRKYTGELASVPPESANPPTAEQMDRVFNGVIMDAVPGPVGPAGPTLLPIKRRQTLDVRVAQAPAGPAPVFTTARVSKYAFGTLPGAQPGPDGKLPVEQLQYNPPNYPMFGGGTRAFMGDYIDHFTKTFVFEGGAWRFNTAPDPSTVFYSVWTDNRDVRPPLDGDWTKYTPAAPPINGSTFSSSEQRPACEAFRTGMRNQNIYIAPIFDGIAVTIPVNHKPLVAQFPRSFIIQLTNPTGTNKVFRLRIANQPPGGRASFTQVSNGMGMVLLTQLDVPVPANSTVSRPVFLSSTAAYAPLRIDIIEIVAVGGPPVPGGFNGVQWINFDPANPPMPNITNETYNPNITNPNITNPNIINPNITNPNITNRSVAAPNIINPNITNPNITNPNITNPNITNPNITNPNITNPNITNPNITNPTLDGAELKDVTWSVFNEGNTTMSYSLKTLLTGSLPPNFQGQIIVHKVYKTPVNQDCSIVTEEHLRLILNIPYFQFTSAAELTNPSITNAAFDNATITLAPLEEGRITLRVLNPDKSSNQSFNPASTFTAVITSQAVNSSDLLQGNTTNPVDTSSLAILTTMLPSGVAGTPYNASLSSVGGIGVVNWARTGARPLAPGIQLAVTGMFSGTPTSTGRFCFDISATDSQVSRSRELCIVVGVPAAFQILNTPNLPVGHVGLAQEYSVQLNAQGGAGGQRWSIQGGELPPGLTLSQGGLINGRPLSLGLFTFTARVDSAQFAGVPEGRRQFNLNIVRFDVEFVQQPANTTVGARFNVSARARSTAGEPLPGIPLAIVYQPSLAVTGLSLQGTTAAVTGADGIAVFPMLSLNRPTTGFFQAAATGAAASNLVASTMFTVTSLITPLAIEGELPQGGAGARYSHALRATGGVAPYVFTLDSGRLPQGLALTRSGLVEGIPVEAGSFTFTARVIDSTGATATAVRGLVVEGPIIESVLLEGQATAALGAGGQGQLFVARGRNLMAASFVLPTVPVTIGGVTQNSLVLAGVSNPAILYFRAPALTGTGTFRVMQGGIVSNQVSIELRAQPSPPQARKLYRVTGGLPCGNGALMVAETNVASPGQLLGVSAFGTDLVKAAAVLTGTDASGAVNVNATVGCTTPTRNEGIIHWFRIPAGFLPGTPATAAVRTTVGAATSAPGNALPFGVVEP